VAQTSNLKLAWEYGGRSATATFAILNVGELSLRVEAELPGTDGRQTPEEQKQLALRHARLLARNLMNALDRMSV
jgi:hypothetical protein